ncbi:Spy/CpxP family protein refolding chaperone [Methylomagnum sp.]
MAIPTKNLLLALALLIPLSATAETTPPPTDAPGGAWGEHGPGQMQARLDQLHTDLKLTPAQEADWKTWIGKLDQAKQERKEARPDLRALRELPTPDRLQKMIDFGKARIAVMEETLAATKTFYNTLTPEQRKTLDATALFGNHGEKGGRREGMRRPGLK